jgi:hypothetical protein
MGLSAMMRLVIEEMGEYFPPRLLSRRAIQHSIVQNFLESQLCQALHKPYDSAVFLYSRSVQRRQVVEYYRIELIRVVPQAGQAAHPNAIRDQKMIEGTVETLKIRADFGFLIGPLLLSQQRRNYARLKELLESGLL